MVTSGYARTAAAVGYPRDAIVPTMGPVSVDDVGVSVGVESCLNAQEVRPPTPAS